MVFSRADWKTPNKKPQSLQGENVSCSKKCAQKCLQALEKILAFAKIILFWKCKFFWWLKCKTNILITIAITVNSAECPSINWCWLRFLVCHCGWCHIHVEIFFNWALLEKISIAIYFFSSQNLVPHRLIFLFACVKSSFDHCKALIFENVKTISLITGDPLSFISIRRKGWRILANSKFDSLANFIY